MTPAEPAPGQLAGTCCRCAAGSRGQEAVTSGVTGVQAGQDVAVWHQEVDLRIPVRRLGSSSRPPQLPDSWTSWADPCGITRRA
jgi:hypothetical protein